MVKIPSLSVILSGFIQNWIDLIVEVSKKFEKVLFIKRPEMLVSKSAPAETNPVTFGKIESPVLLIYTKEGDTPVASEVFKSKLYWEITSPKAESINIPKQAKKKAKKNHTNHLSFIGMLSPTLYI